MQRHRAWMVALLALGMGCEEENQGRGTTIGRDGGSEVDLRFQVTFARAYPAGDAVVESPLSVSLDPCQSSLHVALTDDEGLDDYDIAFASAEPPQLRLHNDAEQEVMLDQGTWLRESVVFDLDPLALEGMSVGSWEADLLVEDEVVAHVPSIVRLATGDANRDGAVDSSDLVTIFQAGTYESGAEATFSSGDFDCDGDADSNDLVKMLQAPEGVAYDTGPYVEPDAEEAWVDDAGRFVVTDYQCWLVAYGPESDPRVTMPSKNRPDRHLLDYSGMAVARECSEASWSPASLEDAEGGGPSGVFYDARVSSFVTAECAYDGVDLEDVNDDLATVGEAWSGGSATITSEGNAARDIRLVCEPYYSALADASGDRFDDDTLCRLDVEGSADGHADVRAFAQMEYIPDKPPAVAPARAESELLLEFPDLSALTLEGAGALETAPPSLQVRGTAIADADGSSPSFDILDHTKCRLITELTAAGPSAKAMCFIEVTGTEIKNMVSDFIDSFTTRGETVDETVHLGWAKEKDDGSLDGPRTLTHQKMVSARPAMQGPVKGAPLGQLRVYSRQEAKSVAKTVKDFIIASDATASATGTVTIRLWAHNPNVPDAYYDEWTDEQRAEWDAANGSRCRVGTDHRLIEGSDPVGPEPEVTNFVIRERGASISLGTQNFDRRYWIGRDGTVQSYLERFGVW